MAFGAHLETERMKKWDERKKSYFGKNSFLTLWRNHQGVSD